MAETKESRRVRVPADLVEAAREALGAGQTVSDRALLAGLLCWVAQKADCEGLPEGALECARAVSARARAVVGGTDAAEAADQSRMAAAASAVCLTASLAAGVGHVRDRVLEAEAEQWTSASKVADPGFDGAAADLVKRLCPGPETVAALEDIGRKAFSSTTEAASVAAAASMVAATASVSSLAPGVRDRSLEEALDGWTAASSVADAATDRALAAFVGRMRPGTATVSAIEGVRAAMGAERMVRAARRARGDGQ